MNLKIMQLYPIFSNSILSFSYSNCFSVGTACVFYNVNSL